MRPDKKIVKYRAMVLYPNTDLKELVDVINPDNNILAKFEDFDEGEIIFSDNLKELHLLRKIYNPNLP